MDLPPALHCLNQLYYDYNLSLSLSLSRSLSLSPPSPYYQPSQSVDMNVLIFMERCVPSLSHTILTFEGACCSEPLSSDMI